MAWRYNITTMLVLNNLFYHLSRKFVQYLLEANYIAHISHLISTWKILAIRKDSKKLQKKFALRSLKIPPQIDILGEKYCYHTHNACNTSNNLKSYSNFSFSAYH
ncbi:hypothetical protein MTR_2g438530 [Medicago truncatula]|uniref:Uncharacterized protein n=1 Tax=Medicago truncatula TaxID=3880 RepID=A0A072VGZ8_MEDTR|nr:hypothetical protein MTR_2g438530 [Medicago truncatula]